MEIEMELILTTIRMAFIYSLWNVPPNPTDAPPAAAASATLPPPTTATQLLDFG